MNMYMIYIHMIFMICIIYMKAIYIIGSVSIDVCMYIYTHIQRYIYREREREREREIYY